MSHLGRQRSRDMLDGYRATAAAMSWGYERDQWVQEHEKRAGWE